MSLSLASSIYRPRRASWVEHLTLRGNVQYQVRHWGTRSDVASDRPTLILAHGWMDVGASFQFMVDHLANHRHVVALDWRGFGGSASMAAVDCYWFDDYLGDLDALADRLSPESPIDLAGHSMGGNIVMSYAGVRPGRIRKLVNLEGFGLPATAPEGAPARLVRWLDELKEARAMRSYASAEEVAERLIANSRRLTPDRAAWLARHWAQVRQDGRWHVLGDPAHRRVNPVLYRANEVLACWRAITAPVLWVEGVDTDVDRWSGDRYPRAEFDARLDSVDRVKRAVIDDCGHMLHLDQPEVLARVIEDFLTG